MTRASNIDKAALFSVLPRLRKFAYSLTGNLPDADDLLQNTVERALTRNPPQEDAEALARWLFTVCRNLWVDEIRARKVRGLDDPAPADVEAQGSDGEPELMGVLQARELEQAMQSLSEDHRVILMLVAVEGYSYREAAELLDVPVGTVMSRLARARSQLAESLGDGNNSPP
ncbi:MAG: RNA polymerase sigma factor [Gammaproteobacteria bacterium]|nr:RNA polymerase sigma factor [Gammaproteobacteria bacterium]